MRGQPEQVIDLMKGDNVDARILPTSVGAHDYLVGPFTGFDFAAAQSIADTEIVNGAIYAIKIR